MNELRAKRPTIVILEKLIILNKLSGDLYRLGYDEETNTNQLFQKYGDNKELLWGEGTTVEVIDMINDKISHYHR